MPQYQFPDNTTEEDYQWFPFFMEMGPENFKDAGGNSSGASGSIATFTKSISNFPFLFHGIRVSNTYAMDSAWDGDAVARYVACKQYVDLEQTVKIELTQQNILAEQTLVSHVVGRDGNYWTPFPCPFPMAGANNISLEMRRVTSYPTIGGDEIIPQCRVALVGCVGRNKMQTQPPHRVGARG